MVADAGRTPNLQTMADAAVFIDAKRDALLVHPMLRRLEGRGTRGQLRALVSELAFFTLVFQDILRLARQRATDPRVVAIAEKLEAGDRGHDQWYLADASLLGIELDVRELFSARFAVTRDVAYAVVAEVLAAHDDTGSLAVTLSLEAASREFFVRVTEYGRRLGQTDLVYFGGHHLAAESEHDLHDDPGQTQLAAIALSPEAASRVEACIERTFDALRTWAGQLDAVMQRAA